MIGRRLRAFHPAAHGPGEPVTLDLDESHHVLRVLRLKPGDAVSVFDGRGREWEGLLEDAARDGAVIRLGAERTDRVEPALELTLFQGLCRPERVELVLQKGTEIGVSAFRLVAASRSEGPPPSPPRLERWRRIVLEACKQSGRRVLPSIGAPSPPPFAPPEGTSAVMLEPGPGVPPLAAIVDAGVPAGAWLAVGPEGGFTAEEIAALEAAGWKRAGLGPRVLRTETAGIVACALVLHAWGDLGSAPRH